MKNHMKRLLPLLLALLPLAGLQAQTQNEPLVGTASREIIPLDGNWNAIIDPYETGYYDYRRQPVPEQNSFFADQRFSADRTRLVEYDFDLADSLRVPGDWNTQRPELYYYEGTIWYRTKFYVPKDGKRTYLRFDGANYETVVGLNGHVLGKHVGGYTPFNFDITDLVQENEYNTLIVKVDNQRFREGVPTHNFDWWNYGGITRSVYLVRTPQTFVRDYFIQLKKGSLDSIEGWIQLTGLKPKSTVKLEIPELKFQKRMHPDQNGFIQFSIDHLKHLQLWSPENPKRYDIVLSISGDTVRDKIGFRSIQTQGKKLLLNGKEIFLKGICLHDEAPFAPSGRVATEQDARILLGWAKELGCNFLRLAHYPHNEALVRAAEEMGIMLWDEIPVYWTIQFDNPETYANAENQLAEMIARDKNRANVIIWSVANETPRGLDRLNFLLNLVNKTRSLDNTRLVTAAMEKEYIDANTATTRDELIQFTDLISFNQYIGWYDGDAAKAERVSWTFDVDKPVLISEWGGGAKAGLHGLATERFTEEYQADLYRKNIEMLDRIPGLVGTTPWILKDFRSPKRMLSTVQDEFNRKGVIGENGEKKAAFYVLQEWYARK
ncbi:MAG: beta-glucuronidase [Bacteroidales bacterium]|nr:beta-glucuronidase [Bacteroidales bacterium]